MSESVYHEPATELTASTRSLHRALSTVREELEAIDWYQQRIDVEQDGQLRSILIHNRDEEIEHATMTLEWLRRTLPKVDEMFRLYLFTEAPIVELEEQEQADDAPPRANPDRLTEVESGVTLGIGSLRRGSNR